MEQENLQAGISVEEQPKDETASMPALDGDVHSRLKLWCKKLIDLSSRNPLVKFNERSQNVLKIIDEKPVEIYRLMVEEGNQLGFLPKDLMIRDEIKAFETYNRTELEQKHVDLFLQTNLEEKSLLYKLRKLSNSAQSSLEEYGYNSLYIALGSVVWHEIEYSDKIIQSPLLLVPVQLIKDSTKNTYKVAYTNEPCILNPALILKFKNDFDIDMSSLDNADEELNPMEVFEKVKNFISIKENWVLSENIYLAILNFENLVIYKDLEANEEEICNNFLVRTICGKDSLNEGTADEIAPMDEYDDDVKPLDTYQIYSADSSQQQAIEVAKKNHNLIIEGPPGTGKSQTITNIIAELLAQGKKVLFVSQKQAALEVVYNKLKEAGLADYCLSLHKNANKSETMTDLAKCLGKEECKQYDNEQHFEKLQNLKTQLNNYVRESDTPCGKLNKTPFEAIEIISKNDDISDIGYTFKNIADWDMAKLNSIKSVLETYVESLKYLGCNPKHHSWYGCDIRDISYSIKNTFIAEVENLKSIFENLKNACIELSAEVVVDEPKTISEIDKMCVYADVLSRYDLHILEENLNEMINKFSLYSQKLTARLSIFQYMQDLNLLSKFSFSKEKLNLNKAVKDLEVLKEIKQRNFSNFGINPNNIIQLGTRIVKAEKDFMASLETISNMVKFNVEESFNQPIEDIELWKIVNKFDNMRNDIDDLANWFNYLNALDKVKDKGFDDFCKLCNDKDIVGNDVVRVFETQFYRLWLYEVVFPQRPELSNFSREKQDSTIAEFHKLDLSQIEIAKVRLNYLLSSQTNVNTDEETSSKTSEIGILKQEAKKTRRQCTLRKLFKNIPNILLKLKPCIMMSPVNVSKLLSNTDIRFDTIIFDEASQLPTEECIAAIIRGNNIVVAGDSKQLPPTSFFKKTYAGTDEEEGEDYDFDEIKHEDMESLLDQCTIANFPQCPLKWHYRSKHEHLIAFSNIYMYENKLYTFPSNEENDGDEYGIRLVPVTSYEDDITDKRMDEARQIAKAVIEHAKYHSDRTLGVVAFNVNQVRRIEDMLEEEKDKHPEVKSFFDKDKFEPFFIKSIENVQGDERDVIFISVGAFKLPNGNLDMRTFSIINQEGGERRLNVLVTRAKRLIKIFSGITDGDFGNVENCGKGVRLLKYYLDFAVRKEDAIRSATIEYANAETESPFEDSVLRVLEAYGYEVKKQVGCANYRIDLAIVDKENPGKYILAVECDGASYHSSATARDRDWLRQKCLQDLGWKIYRIWSTDWFKNRNREIEKLIKAVKEAEQNKDSVKKKLKIEQEIQKEISQHIKENCVSVDLKSKRQENSVFVSYPIPDYEKYTITINSVDSQTNNYGAIDLIKNIFKTKAQQKTNENIYTLTLKEAIYKILEVEAPIPEDEISRRITRNFKNSSSINAMEYYDYYYKILKQEINSKKIISKNDFLYLPDTKIYVRNRNEILKNYNKLNLSPEILRYIPIEEIKLAACEIIKIEFGVEEKELIKLIGKYLGTPCLTKKMLSDILNQIKLDKNIIFQNNKFYYFDAEKPVYITKIGRNDINKIEKTEYQVALQNNKYYSSQEKKQIMLSASNIKWYIHEVLKIEAPIHIDECFERIVKHLAIKSAKDYYWTYKKHLKDEIIRGKIIEKNKFLYLPETKIIVRNRNNSEYKNYFGKIQLWKIPPEEIHLIAMNLIENSTCVSEDELVKYISKEIGFGRMTQNIKDAILEVIEPLKSSNEVKYENGQYSYVA